MVTIDASRVFQPELLGTKARISLKNNQVLALGNQPKGLCHLDASRYDLVPGFIDLQINGAFGFDFTTEPDSLWMTGSRLPELGITTCLPTIVTSPVEVVERAIEVWRVGKPDDYRGTALEGLHLEGPFINPLKKGAHRVAFMRQPDLSLIESWTTENGVRMVTLAPELPESIKLIEALKQRGIIVSAGHSMADVDQAWAGFAAGISHATHLFNAMTPVSHHAPGLAIAVLDDPGISFGLIIDGLHVAPEIVRLVWKSAGHERLISLTDAMAGLGMPDGVYDLADMQVTVAEQSARLADGTLAGSVLTPAQALKNLQVFTGCSLEEALHGWTVNPARILGLSHKGTLKPGAQADIVLLSEEGEVTATFIASELVYQATWAELAWEVLES